MPMVVIAPVENEPVVGPPIRRASGQIVLTLAAITADMIIKPPSTFCIYLRIRGSAGSPFSIGHPAVAMPLWATQ